MCRGRCRRPIERAGTVEPESDLRRNQPERRSLQFAADQRAEPDFDLDGLRAQPRLPVGAGINIAQYNVRSRQNTRFDRAANMYGEAGKLACLLLEGRAVAVPIDHQRGDERGDERDDNQDGYSEQRRLHGVLPLQALT